MPTLIAMFALMGGDVAVLAQLFHPVSKDVWLTAHHFLTVQRSCFALGLFIYFFLVLSETISKPPQMMSSSANCKPFLRSFRHILPQDCFVKLAN